MDEQDLNKLQARVDALELCVKSLIELMGDGGGKLLVMQAVLQSLIETSTNSDQLIPGLSELLQMVEANTIATSMTETYLGGVQVAKASVEEALDRLKVACMARPQPGDFWIGHLVWPTPAQTG